MDYFKEKPFARKENPLPKSTKSKQKKLSGLAETSGGALWREMRESLRNGVVLDTYLYIVKSITISLVLLIILPLYY